MANSVLVIDDEQSIRELMRMSLEMDGYSVILAENGWQGLEIFRSEKPDVVLLDVRMPEMDGLEVLAKIKEEAPDAEVIIISGHGDMDMVMKALRAEEPSLRSPFPSRTDRRAVKDVE